MKKNLNIEFDLALMSLEDVKELKNITVKQQKYEEACMLRDYEKHLLGMIELTLEK